MLKQCIKKPEMEFMEEMENNGITNVAQTGILCFGIFGFLI